MKEKFLLVLCLFCFWSFVQAQSAQLRFVPSTTDTSVQVNAVSIFQDVKISGYLENRTNKTLSVRWERNPIRVPFTWSTQIHDANNNYADFVDSNVDKDIYLDEPLLIPPRSKTKLDVIFSPNGKTGSAILGMEFYLTASPEVIISSEEISIAVERKTAATQKKSSLYPNPSGSILQLANTQDVKRMIVYNMVGRAVKDFEVESETDYDIGNLPNGIYLVGLFDEKGNIIKTVRVSKRGARP